LAALPGQQSARRGTAATRQRVLLIDRVEHTIAKLRDKRRHQLTKRGRLVEQLKLLKRTLRKPRWLASCPERNTPIEITEFDA
jgi:hypothetical protein